MKAIERYRRDIIISKYHTYKFIPNLFEIFKDIYKTEKLEF